MLFLVFAILLLGIPIVGALRYWLHAREARVWAALETTALVIGECLPLVDGLNAAARAERGRFRRQLESFSHQLAFGRSVAGAFRLTWPNCPAEVSGALLAGEAGGTLPTALRQVVAAQRRRRAGSDHWTAAKIYLTLMLIGVPSLFAFLFRFVVPRMWLIFYDFDVPRPGLLGMLSRIASFVSTMPLLLPGISLLVLALLVQTWVARYFLVRAPDRFQPFARLTDSLAWMLPPLRRFAWIRASERQLPILAAAVRAGYDLPDAADHASHADANWFARQRLVRWAAAIRGGAPPAVAAHSVGLPKPWREALCAADPNELAAALDYLHGYYASLSAHWARMLASALLPALVLTLGIVVGTVVVALFVPVVSINAAIAESIY